MMSMSRLSVKIIILLIISIGLFGCLRPLKLPEECTYTIMSMVPPADTKHPRTGVTLLVSMPVASPGYETSGMIYVTEPFRLRFFSRNRWVAPPAQMLMPIFAQSLRNTNYFRAVVTPPFSGTTRYRLDTQLLILEQEFLTPASHVRLVVQATVVNSVTGRVLASRRFQQIVAAPGNNPYAGVLATNEAATRISVAISHFVLNSIR